MQKAGVYLAQNLFVSSSQGAAISVRSVFDEMIAALALSPIPAALGLRWEPLHRSWCVLG